MPSKPSKKAKTATLEREKAHQQYATSNGKVVPGVTTVLGVIAKPALIHWAWKLGMKGKDYKKVSGTAADIGSIAHFLCECFVKNVKPDVSQYPTPDVKKAQTCFKQFKDWWTANKLSLIRAEYQLVSEAWKYGGTLDLVAHTSEGATILVDLKTSNGIYEDYWWQVAAYGELFREKHDHVMSRFIICRIGKEGTGFEVQERLSLDKELRTFKAALALWYAMKKGDE